MDRHIDSVPVCLHRYHINVPPPKESERQFYLRKTKWVFVAIFAPEIVLWSAYQQWDNARRLKRQLQKLARNDKDEARGTSIDAQRFGMTYCIFAAMGGFIVDVSDIHNYLKYVTITPQGLSWLAQRGHVIELPNRAIQDKSKADILAKLLVCVQVVWLIITCIGRKANGFPIALLEIHVLVHVACALCLYGFWAKVRHSLLRD